MWRLKTYFQYLTSLMSKCYCQTILPSRVKCTKINNTNCLLSNFWHCMTRLAASKKNLRCGINVMQREKSVRIATLFTMTIEGEAAVNNAFFSWVIYILGYTHGSIQPAHLQLYTALLKNMTSLGTVLHFLVGKISPNHRLFCVFKRKRKIFS